MIRNMFKEVKYLNWLYTFLCRHRTIRYIYKNKTYIIEYYRLPFFTYEKPSIKLFLTDKLKAWSGQVWLLYPNGGKCGFTPTFRRCLFPRKTMKEYLILEAEYVGNLVDEN